MNQENTYSNTNEKSMPSLSLSLTSLTSSSSDKDEKQLSNNNNNKNNNSDLINQIDSNNINKEVLQKRHYFILEQLQLITNQAPISLKQRLSTELLSTLAGSLLDGTVFEIVNNLYEMQQISERNLFNERSRIYNEYLNQRNQLLKRHKATEIACEIRPHHLSIVQAANKREIDAFDKRMNDELHRFDLKILNEFDKKVLEQQETMSQAGVYGFNPTTNQNDIKFQMHLFLIIQKLSKMKIPV